MDARRWTLTLVAIAGCNARAAEAPRSAPPGVPVEVDTVKAVPLRDASEYVALLRPRQAVQVKPQVDGYVTRIQVAPGDRVKPGTVLMQIDPARAKASARSQAAIRDASRASLAYWREQADRVRKLYAGGAATRQEMDQAQTSLQQAEANAASSAAQADAAAIELAYFKVTASAEGVVGDIPVKLGDLVTPQTLLTTVDDNAVLETLLDVPAERASHLQVGTPIEIIDNAGRTLAPSTVTFISPRADTSTQMVLAKATIDNHDGRLRSFQFARARVIWGRSDGPVVPVLAVQSRAGQSFVWVVRERPGGALYAEQRSVQVGPVQGQTYPVLSGIAAGDKIVVSGVQKLRPGAPVMPLPTK